ncbi:hypothetical protein PSR1_02230 [Anaeromyxobacter sp. PSR-1]|nr:hypothetical protein PSR1_02230 [Anaeromyxobacter sp. PSR-1]
MVAEPAETAVARPVAETVATAGLEDVQAACAVSSRLLPSAYVPVAVNCCAPPAVTVAVAGATAMEVSAGAVTVSTVLPVTPETVAESVAVPDASAVARPEASTVATAGAEDAQLTSVVRSRVEPSAYVPVATSCRVAPARRAGLAGVTAMDDNAGVTVSVEEPVRPP